VSDTPHVDPTPQVLESVRERFGERFVPSRAEAEDAARKLLTERAGDLSRDEAMKLGQLFNTHELGGQPRKDRFAPGFAGASMHQVTQDLERFNEVVADLWTAPLENAQDTLGKMYADRSVLPGAGSSLPSMLLYLRDPEQFGVCLNATMRGLVAATGCAPFKPDSRSSYDRFCETLRDWRQKHGVAPQEVDAVLTALWRRTKPAPQPPSTTRVNKKAAPDTPKPGTIEAVAASCYLSVEILEEWAEALKSGPMRQGLFYGPPGTGKTFVATELAHHLATSDKHVELVQFHPAYSYEDFIEGLRPTTSDSGVLEYEVRPGLFQKLCERAAAAKDETFVLVIDEMNRADVAAVFGEMLMLLEYREDQVVTLPYSQRRFGIPRNVVVLGTMNTADRSLALVDFALRRRFNSFELRPSRDVLVEWAARRPEVDDKLLLKLFDLIADKVGHHNAVAPGHSYWMLEGLDPVAVERVWSYQVRPYLSEHWFERPQELAALEQDVQALIGEQS
jgi:DNA polymerase III delta prime subunit